MGSFFTGLRSKNSGLFNVLSAGDFGPSRIFDKNVEQRVPNNNVPETPYFAGKAPTLADANSGYVHAAQGAATSPLAMPKPPVPRVTTQPIMPGVQQPQQKAYSGPFGM